MSDTKKPTDVIYCAENRYTGEKYIGRTVQPLSSRIKGHYKSAKTSKHKFATALKFYSPKAWVWSILSEVDVDLLDEYEKSFIAKLDTCKNGLNTIPGGSWYGEGSPSYSETLYTLFHPEHGEVTATRFEWVQRDSTFDCITKLVKGKTSHIKGWVLSENKDSYYDKSRLPRNRRENRVYEFYNPNVGLVSCSVKELLQDYIGDSNSKLRDVSRLAMGEELYLEGWVLAINKDIYCELANQEKDYSEVVSIMMSSAFKFTNKDS